MTIHEFCVWLSKTPLSTTIGSHAWVVPSVQTIHILAIAALFSSAALLDARLLNLVGRDQTISVFARRFLPWIWTALPILALSGAILIIGEPSRSLENPSFQLKMFLLLAAIAVTVAVQRPLAGDQAYWDTEPNRRRVAQGLAVTSLLLWCGIIFAGRWIAYVG